MSYKAEAFALMPGCDSINCKIRPSKGICNNDRCTCFDSLTEVQANQIIRTLAKADKAEEDFKAEYQDGYHAGHDAAWSAIKKSSAELCENLKRFNAWRRGKDTRTMDEAGLNPTDIGEWIDMAIHRLGGKP